ncbi:MAG: NADPH:quinone oxidoreductase [Devosia sp.]|uniref:quinone oxidoreductase family protein n=1 Tax=Devosia sp. TaxID=1871048 RepID=UPI0026251191|nr:zinc-binding alcohol dehydrogenase family protein [Devosia sp.]MDB5585238.1 NADPH:quinone oxidoreductase [Devosia sp.]
MKANVLDQFGGPDNFSYRESDTPEPSDGRVLVRVIASGVNLGDALIRSGSTGLPLPLPLVLGSEAAGYIEAVGSSVTSLVIGQRVFAAPFAIGALGGGYATHMVVDAAAVFPILDGVSFEDAVALGVAGITALHLVRAVPVAGRSVLVHSAAGGVGNLLLQLAKARGASPLIATVGSAAKADAIAALGPDLVIDYSNAAWPQAVRDVTSGRGADVIFDAAGGALSSQGLTVLADSGHFVAYGGPAAPIRLSPRRKCPASSPRRKRSGASRCGRYSAIPGGAEMPWSRISPNFMHSWRPDR